jgi:hypothetical protein
MSAYVHDSLGNLNTAEARAGQLAEMSDDPLLKAYSKYLLTGQRPAETDTAGPAEQERSGEAPSPGAASESTTPAPVTGPAAE